MNEKPTRKRARQACTACSARRIKCNVTEQAPCRNCAKGHTSCEIRESRRGKHPRLPYKASSPSPAQENRQPDEVAASEVLAGLSRDAQVEQHTPQDGPVFLGESTTLRYVHQDSTVAQHSCSPASARLLHQVPDTSSRDAQEPPWVAQRRRAKMSALKAEGAFSFPNSDETGKILHCYFLCFHTSFAIVDEGDFWKRHGEGTLSPLLLNAMLFIGTAHSNVRDKSDEERKYQYYRRAKDLYDADYEQDKTIVIQTLFLMSFWRNGPHLEKDTRHWLAAATSLAESKAFHRATGSQGDGLKRRLWWAIYTRETQCAAGLGLPIRIRDADCDVGELTHADFENAFGGDNNHNEASSKSSAEQNEEQVVYQVCIVGLARILGRVVNSGYLPGKTLAVPEKTRLREDLTNWKRGLPPVVQLPAEEKPSLLTGFLHLAYNNLLILIYRADFIAMPHFCSYTLCTGKSSCTTGRCGCSTCAGASIALQAAVRNSRLIEGLLEDGDLQTAPTHVITNLFNTLCVHTIHLRRNTHGGGSAAEIAEHRAQMCLQGLEEIKMTWEVRNWILQLFFQYLDRSTAARLLDEEEEDGGEDARVPEPEKAGPTWDTEEQMEGFLFGHIEKEFAFGEGAYDWGQDVDRSFEDGDVNDVEGNLVEL